NRQNKIDTHEYDEDRRYIANSKDDNRRRDPGYRGNWRQEIEDWTEAPCRKAGETEKRACENGGHESDRHSREDASKGRNNGLVNGYRLRTQTNLEIALNNE